MLETVVDSRFANRRYRVGTVPSVEFIPSVLASTSQHFMLLLALDAAGLSNQVIRGIARRIIRRGMAGLCIWGPDCERVHDQCDMERNSDETERTVVTTTWHSDESLAEAAWYFVNVAIPPDAFAHDCEDWVAISVDNEEWGQGLRNCAVDEFRSLRGSSIRSG